MGEMGEMGERGERRREGEKERRREGEKERSLYLLAGQHVYICIIPIICHMQHALRST